MVELESKGEMSRSQVASFLREFADELEGHETGQHRESPGSESRADITDTRGKGTADAGRRETTEPGRERPTDEGREGVPEEGRQGVPDERRAQSVSEHDHKRITFIIGGKSATVTLPNIVEFDVEVESRSPLLRSGVNQEIELNLSWDIDEPAEEGDVKQIELE